MRNIDLNEPFIWVFDLHKGTQKAVCLHTTSWKIVDGNRQATHPHQLVPPDK